MITASDFYTVMCAMLPLYFAMLLAFAAVRWWHIFSPGQCSGINRFVATFAVPVLSFHFISQNNPYEMNTKFILADTVSKLVVLLLLGLWVVFFGCAANDHHGDAAGWVITLFSVATLPNTLVMGIPLLQAMYGDFTQGLMVQLVVLQCIVWYTLLLFLFEYRAARLLICDQFPGGGAAAIAGFAVDPDVVSLSSHPLDPICADIEPLPSPSGAALRIRIRRASAPPSAPGTATATPRLSSLSSAEIYSVATPARVRTLADLALTRSPAPSGCASSDAYSLQPTPRESNFNEMEAGTPARGKSPSAVGTPSPVVRVLLREKEAGGEKELSFRSTTKFMAEEQDGEHQEMPQPLVMLKLILTVVCRKLSRNPNTYSSILGLLWSLISFKWQVSMPSLVMNSIKIISDAGLGMAMFSLGLFMALQPKIIACGARMACIGMVIRFISGPMIMSAASVAVGLRGVHLHTAIVQAALPQGIVPFVFAREYGLHPDILSTGVIFGMLVSLPVTLLYYILLGL
ncbi:putative membrane transport protein [Dioscorea sansibarensis]